MRENLVTKHKVRKACAPDADLGTKQNLVNTVLGASNWVIHGEKPEKGGDQANRHEWASVRSYGHLAKLAVLVPTVLWSKEKIKDDEKCEIGATRCMSWRLS